VPSLFNPIGSGGGCNYGYIHQLKPLPGRGNCNKQDQSHPSGVQRTILPEHYPGSYPSSTSTAQYHDQQGPDYNFGALAGSLAEGANFM
jgi:hypothetical protein